MPSTTGAASQFGFYCQGGKETRHSARIVAVWPIAEALKPLPSRSLPGVTPLFGNTVMRDPAKSDLQMRQYDGPGPRRVTLDLSCPVCHFKAQVRWENVAPWIADEIAQGRHAVELAALAQEAERA